MSSREPRIYPAASSPSESSRPVEVGKSSMQLFLFQILNGLQLSMLVYLLAAGLTLIFGLMNILNLAHGAFFTLGAYCGVFVGSLTGSFWLALLVGPLLPFLVGVALQSIVLQPPAER